MRLPPDTILRILGICSAVYHALSPKKRLFSLLIFFHQAYRYSIMSGIIKKHKLNTSVNTEANSIEFGIKGALSKQQNESGPGERSYCTEPMLNEFADHYRKLMSHLSKETLPSISDQDGAAKSFRGEWQGWLKASHPSRRTAFVTVSKSKPRSGTEKERHFKDVTVNLHPEYHLYNDGSKEKWTGPSYAVKVTNVASRVWADDKTYREWAFDLPPLVYSSPSTGEIIVGLPPTIRNRETGLAWSLFGQEGILSGSQGETMVQEAVLKSLIQAGFPFDVSGTLDETSTEGIHLAICECVSKQTSTHPKEPDAERSSGQMPSQLGLPQITLVPLKDVDEVEKGSYYHQALSQTTDRTLPTFRLQLQRDPALTVEKTEDGQNIVTLDLHVSWNGDDPDRQQSSVLTVEAFKSAQRQCITTINENLGNQRVGKERSFSDISEKDLTELRATLAWEVLRSFTEDFSVDCLEEASGSTDCQLSVKSDRQLDFNGRPLFEVRVSVEQDTR